MTQSNQPTSLRQFHVAVAIFLVAALAGCSKAADDAVAASTSSATSSAPASQKISPRIPATAEATDVGVGDLTATFGAAASEQTVADFAEQWTLATQVNLRVASNEIQVNSPEAIDPLPATTQVKDWMKVSVRNASRLAVDTFTDNKPEHKSLIRPFAPYTEVLSYEAVTFRQIEFDGGPALRVEWKAMVRIWAQVRDKTTDEWSTQPAQGNRTFKVTIVPAGEAGSESNSEWVVAESDVAAWAPKLLSSRRANELLAEMNRTR